jgi:Putative peptidoglycan binding domain
MGKVHIVGHGDHLAKIASRYGFRDPAIVWEHPQNAALKRVRTPDVLNPGDELFIPDMVQKELQLPAGQAHRFVIAASHIKLRLMLRGPVGEPLASTACDLHVDDDVIPITSSPEGRIEVDIPADTRTCKLVLPDREIAVLIGHLDPVEEPSGQRARLSNLGYAIDLIEDNEDLSLRSAVEEFQCDHLGPAGVDGVCGPSTRAKLKEVHGS